LLDEAVLHALAADLGEDGLVEVIQLFLTEAPRRADRLENAAGSALLREVHMLASAARSVGLLRAGHAAASIELAMASTDPGPDQVADLLNLLREGVGSHREMGTHEAEGTEPSHMTSVSRCSSAGRRSTMKPS
jgi:HPt (histidine-containing phosphotransfer) domain-containing protein